MNAAIAAYYYFHVLKVMTIDEGNEDRPPLKLATADQAWLVALALDNLLPILFWGRITPGPAAPSCCTPGGRSGGTVAGVERPAEPIRNTAIGALVLLGAVAGGLGAESPRVRTTLNHSYVAVDAETAARVQGRPSS